MSLILYRNDQKNRPAPTAIGAITSWALKMLVNFVPVSSISRKCLAPYPASHIGTARAQGQLKQNLLGMAAAVFPWPEYLLGGAKDKLVNGELENEKSRELLTGMLSAFGAWVRAVKLYQQR